MIPYLLKNNIPKTVYISLFVFILYSFLSFLSAQFFTLPEYGILIWLPAGITAGALASHGYKYWSVVFISAILNSYFYHGLDASQLLSRDLIFALGETLQAIVVAFLLVNFLPNDHEFLKSSNINKLLLMFFLAALIQPLFRMLVSLFQTNSDMRSLELFLGINWYANSIGLLVAGSIYYVVSRKSSLIGQRRKYIFMASIGGTFALVSIILSLSLKTELDLVRQQLSSDIDRFEEKLLDKIEKHIGHTEILASYFTNTDSISKYEFHSFVGKLIGENNDYFNVGWAPLITQNDRAKFEQEITSYNQSHNQIWKYEGEKEIVVSNKNEYLPVQYSAQDNDEFDIIGIDILEDKVLSQLVNTSISLQSVNLSSAVTFKLDNNFKYLLSAQPVISQSSDTSENRVKGLVLSTVRVDLLFKELLQDFNLLYVKIDDITGTEKYELFQYQSDNEKILASFTTVHQLTVLNRTLQFQYDIAPEYESFLNRFNFWWIALSGLLLIWLSGYLSLFLSSRSEVFNFVLKNRTRELVEHKSLLNSINKLTKVGGWNLDVETNQMDWTEECFQIYNLDHDTTPNRHVLVSCMIGSSKNQFEDAIDNALKHKTTWDLDIDFQSLSNVRRTLRASGGVILEHNKVVSLYGSFQDITDIRNAEINLEIERNRFLNLVNSMKCIVWEVDALASELLYISPQVEAVMGYTPDELKQPGFWQSILHEEDLQRIEKIRASSIETLQGYEIDYRYVSKEGKIHWITDVVSIVVEKKGQYLLRGITVDITDRKILEQQNQSSKELLQSALDIANAAAFNFQLSNSQFKWESIPKSFELHNDPIESWIRALMVDVIEIASISALTSQGLNDYKFEKIFNFFDDEGHSREYLIFLQVAFDQSNKPISISGLCQDVTEKANAEQEQRNLNKQLQQAQKMEAIGQLTGGIAHDFNNILSSILGFTTLAMDRFVTDDQVQLKDYLHEVIVAGEKARDLVSQMLVFSRNSDDEATDPIDVELTIKEIIKLLQASLPASISFHTSFAAQLPRIKLHPVKVNQLLMNLCINSSHSMNGKGEIIVKVGLKEINNLNMDQPILDAGNQSIANGRYTSISVSDSGGGISAENLQKIFDPFFSTKDVGKGTGMGLAMVLGIVRKAQGAIFVNSVESVGTEFEVLLPAWDNETEQKVERSHEQLSAVDSNMELRGNILVVDDEISIIKFLSHLLEDAGYQVTGFDSSVDALSAFKQDMDKFDLIISDQTMPKLTGLELVSAVRELQSQVPVIICSGYSIQMNNLGPELTKQQGFIPKPIDPAKLIEMVDSLIRKSHKDNF